ncbi:MAG: hypothetical protein IIX93_07425, partial [Clostridia bacterium]|nr:hypothetical protein [Clostridia bacterium]
GGNEDSVVTIEPVVEPMGVLTLSFSHVVTEEDVERGYVENTATAMWFNPEIEEAWTIDSNTVVVPTEPGDFGMSSQMTVAKKITSEPANGVCFVPGEVISFTVSVTNDSEDSLYQMDVIDLLDGSLIGEFDEVLPGETVYSVFEYTVSDFDAITGGVENSAYVYADDPAGEEILEFSNSVYANCGFAEYPFGILSGLEITKEEESLPLNGDYYVLGEEITYLITYFNAGEIPLGEVIVYDSLAGLTDIASAESLDVGESRVCRYKHVVTEADVERGYVANTAYAEYMVNGYMNYAVSEPVYSDTDGIDNEPVYSWPIFGVIDFDTLKQGEDFCEHKLTERTASSETAEIGFCAEHADNHEMLRTMLGFANDSALLAQTYEYAALLWKEEVNKLYAELLKACDAEAHATVIYEFAVFSAYASNHEVFMNSLYSANPEIAKKAVSDLWRNKLIDMCLEINTAPDGRNDSLLSRAQKASAAEAACGVFEKSADEKGVVETMAFCPQHSFLYGMTDKLVKSGSAADWNNVRQLWNVELTKAVNSAVKNAGDEAGAKIILDNGMFAAWLEARAALLTVLYPENPEIVSEVVVSMIMEHVNGLCAMNK